MKNLRKSTLNANHHKEKLEMKVILLESTNNVGMVGEVVNVRPGFARNYLLPKKKAVIADGQNMKAFEHQKRMMEGKIEKAKQLAEGVRGQLDGQEVVLARKTAKANKLFGSVTTLDIQKAVAEQLEVEVNRKGIALSEPIKQLGNYTVSIKLDGGVQAAITVIVEQDETQVFVEAPKPEPKVKAADVEAEDAAVTEETTETKAEDLQA
ncbi:MAG: 50S ribosomal protein L9 [Bdellovibrionota bacterium]